MVHWRAPDGASQLPREPQVSAASARGAALSARVTCTRPEQLAPPRCTCARCAPRCTMVHHAAPCRGTSLGARRRTRRCRCCSAGCSTACAGLSSATWTQFAGSRAASATWRGFGAALAALKRGCCGPSEASRASREARPWPRSASECVSWLASLGLSRRRRLKASSRAPVVGRRRTVGRALWGAFIITLIASGCMKQAIHFKGVTISEHMMPANYSRRWPALGRAQLTYSPSGRARRRYGRSLPTARISRKSPLLSNGYLKHVSYIYLKACL